MSIRFAGLLAAGLLLVPGVAGAQTLTNGSFETYQGMPGPGSIRSFIGGNDVTGWSFTGDNTIYESNGQDGINAGSGTHWISFGHNGGTGDSLSQVISATVLGTLYRVNYLFRLQQGTDDNSFFTVGIDGGSTVMSGVPSAADWGAGTPLTFMGTGGAVTLRFTDSTVGGGNSNLALDGVRLSVLGAPGGVPEPATWAMLIMGFGAIGGALRARRRAAGEMAFA